MSDKYPPFNPATTPAYKVLNYAIKTGSTTEKIIGACFWPLLWAYCGFLKWAIKKGHI